MRRKEDTTREREAGRRYVNDDETGLMYYRDCGRASERK